MISKIEIHGFKSFQNFEMEFTPFTVIAGVNASGKSNLFDALRLLARLAETDNMKRAFKEQRGDFNELFTQYDDKTYANEMSFSVEMLVNKNVLDDWGNSVKLKYTRLRYELKIKKITNDVGIDEIVVTHEKLENLKHQGDKWVENLIPIKKREIFRPKVNVGKRGIPYIYTAIENSIPTIFVPQDGSQGVKRRFPLINATRTVLSSFDNVDFPHVLAAKEEMRSWKFLQLNPEDLRTPTDKTSGNDIVTSSGENLAAALFRIKQNDAYNLVEISRKLNSFLPNFTNVDVIDDIANKQYVIVLKDINNKEYSSRVLSEGTLRILALCVLGLDSTQLGLLCFEEPENGINPSRIPIMSQLLMDLTVDFADDSTYLKQVIINSHSPIIVSDIYNYKLDKRVGLWYASMKNSIVLFNEKRYKLDVTRILPVLKENSIQLTIIPSDKERKLTLIEVEEYLNQK